VLNKLSTDVGEVMSTYEKDKVQALNPSFPPSLPAPNHLTLPPSPSFCPSFPLIPQEFKKLSEEIKAGVMATAAVEAGAATVGALVAAHALDVTGICNLSLVRLLISPTFYLTPLCMRLLPHLLSLNLY